MEQTPQPIIIRHLKHEPEPQNVYLYPDYLIGLLLAEGRGLLEADAKEWSQDIGWRFTNPTTDVDKVLWHCPVQFYRPLLAQFARLVGINYYAGHAFFTVQMEDESEPRSSRFSLYLSNTMTGFWIKLYHIVK